MSGNFGLWRAPTAEIRILHRNVSRPVVTSQLLVSSSQVADRTRVLNYFHDMLVASYSRTIMIDHLDVRIKIEVMAERDQVLFDFLCWSDKPEKKLCTSHVLLPEVANPPRPVWILEERELVEGCPHIAGGSRIRVVLPGASHIRSCLEN